MSYAVSLPPQSTTRRCANCTRLTDNLDANGLCYGCRPKPAICDCLGVLRHEPGCPAAGIARCGWCRRPMPELARGSTGLCRECARGLAGLAVEDPSGPEIEAAMERCRPAVMRAAFGADAQVYDGFPVARPPVWLGVLVTIAVGGAWVALLYVAEFSARVALAVLP